MRRPGPWAAFLIVAGSLAGQAPAGRIDLKVLYTGAPESRRTREFTEFLGKTFTEVGTVELQALDAKSAAKYDVVIVDSPSPYRQGAASRPGVPSVKLPEAPELTPAFTKPTILMGAAGGAVLNRLEIKLDWL